MPAIILKALLFLVVAFFIFFVCRNDESLLKHYLLTDCLFIVREYKSPENQSHQITPEPCNSSIQKYSPGINPASLHLQILSIPVQLIFYNVIITGC